MRKLLALLCIIAVLLSFAACTDTNVDTSKADQSADQSSTPAESDQEQSKAEPSDEPESSETESSDDESAESSTEDNSDDTSSDVTLEIPPYISNFISTAAISTNLRATDATSVRLTKVNEAAGYGDVALFTYDYFSDHIAFDGDSKAYAVFVAEYDHSRFGTFITSKKGVGEYDGADVAIPADGFVLVIHEAQNDMLDRMMRVDSDTSLFVAGVQTCNVGYTITKTDTPITIDGVIDSEWQFYKIDTIDENNSKWTYSSFSDGNYYTTAEYYVCFDDQYIYLAVVVNSPYHYCPVTPAEANGMWKYECIQVKLSVEDPKGEYIGEHYDHVIDKTADNDGIVRAYGFAVNDEGETCYYENSPKNKTFMGKAVCKRDDEAQTTVYEIAFDMSEFGVSIEDLETIGLTFSINSTNEDDVKKGTWRNLILRDGGGVIGRNDWAKIPAVSLMH